MAVNGIMTNSNTNYNNQIQSPQMVSLGRLIEFSVQRTYHELIVLAELLPRKTDMERKIEIVQFANRTRQLFVRLLALVKWAGSASKVEKCSSIVSFLDQQSMLFVETANNLARMARETLVNARLPSFQLPCAVEVLTFGTYSKLPTCIRDRIVPPDSITSSERKSTLLRLNQIIQQRLVTSALPIQMRNLKIENGKVTFHVDHEFELSLTLLGDSPAIPWRVLNIEILVEDKETGSGKDLVHPFQIIFLQQLIQSRFSDSSKPLVEFYNCLHSFCLSLQLEVLQAQAIRLCSDRLGDFIRIENYMPGSKLLLSYWREQFKEEKIGFKLCVEIDPFEPSKPLQVTHLPELGTKETYQTYQAIKSDYLSIEKVLIHTTHERAKQKLNLLKREFYDKGIGECHLSGSPAVLHVSFLQPCMISERLLISVDVLTGYFLAHIPQFENCLLVEEIENVINKDYAKITEYFTNLRIWVTRERCKKTVQSLPVFVTDSLPFSPFYENPLPKGSKLFYQFSKHHQTYLMTTFEESNGNSCNVNIKYYLIDVEPISLVSNEQPNSFEMELSKAFLKVKNFLELDVSNIVHQNSFDDVIEKLGKRKISDYDEVSKKLKTSGYYIPELSHVISFCEEKLAYNNLSHELYKRSICHQVLQDSDGYTHVIDVVKFPKCSWCPEQYTSNLQADTLSCSIRLQGKGSKIWNITFIFGNPPLQSQSLREHGKIRLVYINKDYSNGSQLQLAKMVDELLQDWTAIARLYDVVKSFSLALQSVNNNHLSLVDIKSFSYKKLVLGYGPNKSYTVTIYWKSVEKRFQLLFGVVDHSQSGSNPHVIVNTQLQHEFNQHNSISQLVQVLQFTLNPLLTIQNMSCIPLLGVVNSRPNVLVQSFCVIPQSSTHIRLLYRNMYCLDVTIHSDGLVAIRDGAYSLFDKSKVVDDLTPIQNLKAFLNKFVDKNTQMRRLSQTEDDNPPSPVSHLESVESYMFQSQIKTASPIKTEGRGISHQITTSQGSNPHTPTSPHTSLLSNQPSYNSPGNFPLASPPSHGISSHNVPVSSVNQIAQSPSIVPDQSPGNIFGVNSPMNPLHAPSPSQGFLPTASPSGSSQFHSHSPVSQFLHGTSQSSHDSAVGSPFTSSSLAPNLPMQSPASSVWPGSPSIPRPSPRSVGQIQSPGSAHSHILQSNILSPQQGSAGQMHSMMNTQPAPAQITSRLLPQRSWAAAIPTLLTHHGFDIMCRPNAPTESAGSGPSYINSAFEACSQLERFLGCVSMRRNLQRGIQNDETFTLMPPLQHEPGVITYKNDSLIFKINLNPSMQALNLKINPAQEYLNQWNRDELETLQQFFESKVVCAPYKPNAYFSYNRILNAPIKILKDCVQLMRLEMFPDRNLRWSIHWCLTIPPASPPIGNGPQTPPTGMSAILMNKNKMLIFIKFNRMGLTPAVTSEPNSIIVPIIYDMSTNTLSVHCGRRDNFARQTSPLNIINSILERFAEYQTNTMDCMLYPAIREIMANFQL